MTKDSEAQSSDPSKELTQQLKEATGAVKSLDEMMREAKAALETRGEQKGLGKELHQAKELEPSASGHEKATERVGTAILEFGKAAINAAYSGGMKDFVAHGSHELANALFNGGGYVMYPRGSHDNGAENDQQEKEVPSKQIERGGMSM
jgi:hypothetical protein